MHAVAGSAFAFGSAPTIVKVKAAKRTAGGDSPGERMFSIGLDFGTNSVRALVVRCSDGAECGSSVVDYPSGAKAYCLIRRTIISRGKIRRLSRRPGEKRRGRARGGGEKARLRPGESRRRRRRLRRDRARCRSTRRTARSPLERALEGRSLGAMLAVEGPHRLARSGEDHRAPRQAPPGIHRQMRRRLFVGMVLVQDLALPERRAGDFRGGIFVGRTRRLDSVRARRRDGSAGDQAGRLRGRPQGALCGRMGRPARQGVPERARSAAGRFARPPLRKGL